MISNRLTRAGFITLLAAATLNICPKAAQAQAQGQYDDQNRKPASENATQPQPPAQAQPPAQTQPAQASPAYQRAAIQATDGRYVAPNGTIDGSNLKQFLNSGPDISATQMEEASIPADNLMQMPESVNNRADARAQEKAQERAGAGQVSDAGQPQNPHKKAKKYHAHPILGAVAQPFVSTLNFMGFPVGLNEDKGIDASLSSDLPQRVRDADGAYNPNAKPGSQQHTNTWFGQ